MLKLILLPKKAWELLEYKNGSSISGTHSLAKYINDLGAESEYLNVSKAIYAFAEAAKEYKLEEIAAE